MRPFTKSAAVLISCFVLALVFLAPAVIHGDDWNRATRFTINHTFEVPGTVLQADTPYVIRLLDSPSERHVVQIFNDDQSKLLTTFIAISDERMQATDNTVFTFFETQPGWPVPVKEWFYPGRTIGLEFIYGKEQLSTIALHMRTQTIQTAEVSKSENTAVLEKPSVTEPLPTEADEQPAEQPTQIAQNDNSSLKTDTDVDREKPSETPAATEETKELPRTAGELPLIALIGLLSLGTGLGVKVISAKS